MKVEDREGGQRTHSAEGKSGGERGGVVFRHVVGHGAPAYLPAMKVTHMTSGFVILDR